MLKEFKEFAFKGNVIDLAVGVIIGGAFGKIVTSLVNDLIMPIIGIILGGINFSDLKLVIRPASNGMEEAAIKYGAFIQSVVDFLIIAVCIFLFVKLANTLTRKKEEEKKPEKPSADVVLLTEIRDLLKKN
jgi:large conductance mechanosensitive channel protein